MTAQAQAQPQPIGEVSIDTAPRLNTIGIEVEYPYVAPSERNHPAPRARDSTNVFNNVSSFQTEAGTRANVTSEHTGSEIIVDGTLELHSDEPEEWYESVLQRVAQAGYPFAATGNGSTSWGMHTHVSEATEEQIDEIFETAGTNWGQLFFMSSVEEGNIDPLRTGIHAPGTSNWTRTQRRRWGSAIIECNWGGPNHYEIRFPEPMYPEHFSMYMHWLRLISLNEFEEAREYAKGRVEAKDRRITSIRRYLDMRSAFDDWPPSKAEVVPPDSSSDDRQRFRHETAEYLYDLMEE